MDVGNSPQGFTGGQGISDRNRIAYEKNSGEVWDVLYGRQGAFISLGAQAGRQASEYEIGNWDSHGRQSDDFCRGVKSEDFTSMN